MDVVTFIEKFFELINNLIFTLFGVEFYEGILSAGEFSYALVYIFCFSGFALFGFTMLYFVFSLLRGDR